MFLNPDYTQASWEFGASLFSALNIRAIRRSKNIQGVHWFPTVFFTGWGVYNLWFYSALNLPLSWCAGTTILAVNLIWLSHAAYYGVTNARLSRNLNH